jgi:tetratricopeptide (TPR) repeat protein
MNKQTSTRAMDAKILNDAEQALARNLPGRAEEACKELLVRDPQSSSALFLLGVSQLRQNKLKPAIRSLKKAIRIFPQHVNAVATLGQAYITQGEHTLAEESFRTALGLAPGNGEIAALLILSLMNQARFSDALVLLDNLLSSNPNDADAFNKRGFILQQFGRHDEAIGNFCRALMLQPAFPEAFNNRGNSLKETDRHLDAIDDYDQAIRLRPDYGLPYSNKSLCLLHLKRFDEALQACDKALDIAPNFADALNNKGFLLQKVGRFEEAIEWFERALSINGRHSGALNNLAYSLQQIGELSESAKRYEELLSIRPGYPEAIWNRGLLKLLRGDLETGWADMEWRWQCKEFMKRPGQAGVPEWRGENLSSRSIAVFAEQGFGDLFQFCRYLPLLADRGANVTLVAPSLVHRLLSTLDPRLTLAEPGHFLSGIDYQCNVLSLPYLFKTTLSTIPAIVPYLRAEQDLIAHWQEIIASDELKVGISWQGNPSGWVDFGRSIPLEELRPLAQVKGVKLISLQFQHGTDQIERVADRIPLQVLPDFNERKDGFIDTAAVISCLDLVITSDSAPAHLAGALNVPVWVMLKATPDWRWMMDRADNPWYPSMQLFRQKERDNWADVVDDVASSLKKLAQEWAD